MPERLLMLLHLSMAISFVLCSPPDKDDDVNKAEFRGFHDFESWKPEKSSAPEVILIKQKDPHAEHMASFHSIKHHLPLLAVASLVAVSVLLPLKAYFGPSYLIYPPVVTAAPPPADNSKKNNRVGKAENENFEQQSLAMQVMNMIEEIDKVYGELAAKDKKSKT